MDRMDQTQNQVFRNVIWIWMHVIFVRFGLRYQYFWDNLEKYFTLHKYLFLHITFSQKAATFIFCFFFTFHTLTLKLFPPLIIMCVQTIDVT